MAQGNTGGHQFETPSWALRLVAEYTGLNFKEVLALDYYQYLVWRRDAYITHLERTEGGREYLRNAWRMTQTEPDRVKLRRKFGKENKDGE